MDNGGYYKNILSSSGVRKDWMMVLIKYFFVFIEKQITSETQKSVQCGTWTKHADGGVFTSPNYPSKYPPDRECVYIIEGKSRENARPGRPAKAWPSPGSTHVI